ncbi:hypothetical protein JXO52_01665 [bacterium]|nr:hypothetical protein [bacterium]
MINLEERTDMTPQCPYCKRDLATLAFQQIRSFLGKRYLYFCPGCRAAIGVSHRKGLWMG